MTQVVPYKFENTEIRVVEIDGEPWFVGKEIAETLGYADATTAIRSHCKGVQTLHPLPTDGGMQNVRILSEPDMLRLVVNSTLPAAERFERWVFEEVLPSIRKTGGYTAKSATSPLKVATEAAKAFPSLVRVARLLGCDKNAAAAAILP